MRAIHISRPTVLVLRVGVVAALMVTGYLHADLYIHGYRVIPEVGFSFLVLASGCFAVGLLLLVGRSVIMQLAAAALAAGALAGFVASRTVGIFGFVERGLQPAPQALLSVLAEIGALVLLAGWVVADRRSSGGPRPTGQGPTGRPAATG
jgi:hypothetical protein